MLSPLPITDHLSIAVRAFAETTRGPVRTPKKEATPSEHVVVFDCETTTDATQRLRFGTYQHRVRGALRELGLFYAEDLPPMI